jgi:hypothetical protein
MEALREALFEIVAENQPVTVRGAFYLASSRGVIPKTENEEEVSHVDQRPDRPSEIDQDYQKLLSPIHERAPKPGLSSRLGRNVGRAPPA